MADALVLVMSVCGQRSSDAPAAAAACLLLLPAQWGAPHRGLEVRIWRLLQGDPRWQLHQEWGWAGFCLSLLILAHFKLVAYVFLHPFVSLLF